MKPFTLPDSVPDHIFVEVYARDVARFPALLTGLKRPDGTLYLPKAPSKRYQTATKSLPKRTQKQVRSAA